MKKEHKGISYQQALEEIEKILGELENGTLDIDHMAEEVKKAANLIKYCKQKLLSIEGDVNSTMESMDDA